MGSHTEIISLIARAREAGLVLWVEGSRLRFRTTATTIPEDLRAELRTQRQAIIEVLILEAAVRVERCPLAVNQRGLWYLNHLAPQSSAYNLSFIVRVHGALDRSALEETLQIIVDRHESLRTIFPGIDGEPVRIVVGHAKASLEQTDATSCPPEDVRNLVRAEHAWPFDLTHGPVFRARLFRETPERHILQLVVHHLVADGTSLFVLGEELFETYSALLKGTPLPTRENQATFSEFVDWQARALTAADADAKYWTGVLQPPPPPLDLPTDRPRPRFRRMKGATIRRQLDQKIVTGLHELAKQEGTTDFVLLLSIWFLLLHRLSGKNDVTVGTPVLGRPAARFERTVGDLINMLPLRVRDIANLSFRELVQQVREIVLNGMARQDFPLPRMVEMQDRHAEHLGPPFQTLFLLQHFGRSSPLERLMFSEEDQEVTYNELTLSSYSIDQQEGQFDLALDLWPAGDRMLCLWRIDTELFDMETVEAWADSYESLTASVVADPLAAVTRLPLLSHEVKEKQIRTFNATEREYPREATVLSLFSGQVKRRPSAVAVSFEGDELSYAQLDARSTRLARHLQTLGVGPNTHAGVCLDRGLDMLVAVLGILKAGGAYVPLDPGFPAERLGYMLKDSGVQVLVTQDGLGQRLFPAAAVHRVCMDSDALVIGQQSTESLPVQAGSQDCAYVIYTSGSTGRSKGVEIEHRALTNFLCSMAREPGLEEHDVLVAVTTLSFDIAGLELFLPLIVGARIELVSRESGLDGERLARIIASSGATVMQATPATWRMLLESGWQGCPQLKVLCGGEAMGRDLAQRLLPVVGEVWNLYGPTETTIWSSVARISSAADISIGRPIANTRMYVLDEHGEPVPRGVVGELWIGGAGVARGYLNRAELTGERFVRDPYHEGTRMYRTGDLARHLPDGRLECLGRIDNQVKIRGYRIELEEIEAALSAHTGVYDCIVTARKEHAGDLRLLAYVVSNGAHRPAIEDLRTHLKTILPDYMIPSGFAFLDTIPLTPNGKVDRNALPTLGEDLSDLTVDYVAPRNHVERVMAEIWAEVLGVKSVGVFDHFFELGGHSLSATRLIGRLKSTLQIDVPLTSIFIEPTIAGLSKRIFYDDYAQRYYYVGEICRWNRLVPAQPKGSR